MAVKFFISREGETEQWYFEWLQREINSDVRAKNKIEFKFKNVMPSSFSKSNASMFTKEMLNGAYFCRVQDIEDYQSERLQKFEALLKSNKEAKKIFPKFNFSIGYSNYTFEVWMIAHRANVRAEVDRKNYYKQINSAYGKSFQDNDDYKHERNFKSLLDMLTLDDVINNAIPRCEQMRRSNIVSYPHLKRSAYNFDYFLNNPDTSLHEFVKQILLTAGIIEGE